tara:strand:- start:4285 stop:4554 length:270 start_codon:yes stop_codon:yes gene_type:complete
MSDTAAAPQTDAPTLNKEAVAPPTAEKTPAADPTVAVKTETEKEKNEDSLAKLLKHINELQAENSELEEAMKLVRDGNLAKLKASVAVC